MIKRPVKNRRNRRGIRPGSLKLAEAIATPSIVATKVRLTFDRPVVLQSLPTGITLETVAPTAAVQVDAQIIDLTYTAPPSSADVLVIPKQTPGIRVARGGGYVAAQHYVFPGA